MRDAYNEALSREAEERGGGEGDEDDLEDGDPELFERFRKMLPEQMKREQIGHPFPKSRGALKTGDKSRGGSVIYHHKR